jgi:hypothetical protein
MVTAGMMTVGVTKMTADATINAAMIMTGTAIIGLRSVVTRQHWWPPLEARAPVCDDINTHDRIPAVVAHGAADGGEFS